MPYISRTARSDRICVSTAHGTTLEVTQPVAPVPKESGAAQACPCAQLITRTSREITGVGVAITGTHVVQASRLNARHQFPPLVPVARSRIQRPCSCSTSAVVLEPPPDPDLQGSANHAVA